MQAPSSGDFWNFSNVLNLSWPCWKSIVEYSAKLVLFFFHWNHLVGKLYGLSLFILVWIEIGNQPYLMGAMIIWKNFVLVPVCQILSKEKKPLVLCGVPWYTVWYHLFSLSGSSFFILSLSHTLLGSIHLKLSLLIPPTLIATISQM